MVFGYKSKMNLTYNSVDLTEFSGGGPISGCMRNNKNELKNVVPGNRYQVQVVQLSIDYDTNLNSHICVLVFSKLLYY